MSAYKEGYMILKQIEAASKQLWNDSCDYGAVTTKGDKLWNVAKQLIKRYGIKDSRSESRYGTGVSVSQVVELMDEWNTGAIERFRIHYVSILPKYKLGDGYLSIDRIN